MCIIIDTNTFSGVFIETSSDHNKFKPVHDWIFKGKGKVVYGGAKYRNELREAKKYLGIFNRLKRKRKTVEICDESVDSRQERIEKIITAKAFNDAHLVAIAIESGCRIICTGDKESHEFIKNPAIYPENCKRPFIYSNSGHHHLLTDDNITGLCK